MRGEGARGSSGALNRCGDACRHAELRRAISTAWRRLCKREKKGIREEGEAYL
jgi:hypothetical protein